MKNNVLGIVNLGNMGTHLLVSVDVDGASEGEVVPEGG